MIIVASITGGEKQQNVTVFGPGAGSGFEESILRKSEMLSLNVRLHEESC